MGVGVERGGAAMLESINNERRLSIHAWLSYLGLIELMVGTAYVLDGVSVDLVVW